MGQKLEIAATKFQNARVEKIPVERDRTFRQRGVVIRNDDPDA